MLNSLVLQCWFVSLLASKGVLHEGSFLSDRCKVDMVAIFAHGQVGLCAAAGARLMGASTIIAVDQLPNRLALA